MSEQRIRLNDRQNDPPTVVFDNEFWPVVLEQRTLEGVWDTVSLTDEEAKRLLDLLRRHYEGQATENNKASIHSKTAQVTLTADVILLRRLSGQQVELLLVKRGRPPFAGSYAFPGGKVQQGESAEVAAIREVREETGVQLAFAQLHQLATSSDPGRDPRGRFVSVVFLAVAEEEQGVDVQAGDDAAEVAWFPLLNVPDLKLAFDHGKILADTLDGASTEILRSQLPLWRGLSPALCNGTLRMLAVMARAYQQSAEASLRQSVLKVIQELTFYHDPLTVESIQHALEGCTPFPAPRAMIEQILATLDQDVVCQIVAYGARFTRTFSIEDIHVCAQHLYQQDIPLARIAEILRMEGLAGSLTEGDQ